MQNTLKRVTVTFLPSDGLAPKTITLETDAGQAGYAAYPSADNPVAIKAFAGDDTIIVPFGAFQSVVVELNIPHPQEARHATTQVG